MKGTGAVVWRRRQVVLFEVLVAGCDPVSKLLKDLSEHGH